MDLAFSQKIIDELGIPQIIDVRDQLPRNPKNNWADLAGFRNFSDLDTNGLHHDAYPKANRISSTPMQMMAEIANMHIKNKSYDATGEGGIPYHIYIMRGQAYYCNEISWRTYGISNHNGHVIHICVHGDYVNFDVLTDADRNCLIGVCIMLRQIEAMPNLRLIKGHKELSPTECPGYDFNSVKNDVETAEHRMIAGDTWGVKVNQVNELANQYQYMFDLMKAGESNGDANWAMNQLLDVRGVLKQKGLL